MMELIPINKKNAINKVYNLDLDLIHNSIGNTIKLFHTYILKKYFNALPISSLQNTDGNKHSNIMP